MFRFTYWRVPLAFAGALGLAVGLSGCGGPMGPFKKEVISTPDAPKAIGPYSQAIRVGNTVFLAGQIPIDPKTNQLNTGTIEEQTRLVMANLGAVLKASDMTFDNVVMATVRRAPEHGQHTEAVLLAHGFSWEEISALKEEGAIM
mgnify:CR=1 FL=1